MDEYEYVERADPDLPAYQEGTRRHFNVIDRYTWANEHISGIVLDVPCGMGWGASLLTNAKAVIGIDNNREALVKARTLFPRTIFVLDNMRNVNLPDACFDSIICFEGYEHLERGDQYILIEELYRAVKPSGVVLLTVPIAENVGDWSGNKFHLYEPTLEEVEDILEGKFEIIEMTKPNVARYRLRPIK